MTTPTELPRALPLIGTTAIHKLGDISRPEGDLCYVHAETETDYIGNWAYGYGFIEVRFPKASTRPLTRDEEIRYRLRLPENPPVVDIEGWSIVDSGDPYLAPELNTYRLFGAVRGHPTVIDGHRAETSRIMGKRGELVATQNTLYRLGAVDAAYETAFPNARERLLASLEEV